jgi:hypothetical protein
MTEHITFERWLYRLGAWAAITGSLMGLVGNLLHPATPIGNPEGVALAISQSKLWVYDHLAIVLGIILMLGGLVALYHSLSEGVAGALARFGYVTAIAGITVGVILVTLDGVAAKQLADRWAVAAEDEKAVALGLVIAEETLNFALASLFNILFAGVTFILYGLAVALSHVYPRWLGWIAVVAGLGSIVAGTIQAFAGEPTPASRMLTIVMPTIITLWLFVIGIFLARKG